MKPCGAQVEQIVPTQYVSFTRLDFDDKLLPDFWPRLRSNLSVESPPLVYGSKVALHCKLQVVEGLVEDESLCYFKDARVPYFHSIGLTVAFHVRDWSTYGLRISFRDHTK